MSTAGRGAGTLVVAVLGLLAAGPAHASGHASTVLRWQDPAVTESSGLLDLGDRVATVNDSGDGPWVYLVDRSTGRTTVRTTYSTDPVVDVEALAEGPGTTVWVGDIGDNDRARDHVSVYRLPRPGGPGDTTVPGRRYDLVYPDGPHDAETLLVDPRTGRLYVVTKGLFGGQVLAAPRALRTSGPNHLHAVGDAGGLVTDGAFLPDGRHVVLRTYSTATLYAVRGWRPLASMNLPAQPQGEGLAVDPSGTRLLLSTEGAHTPVLSVPLSARMRAALAPAPAAKGSPGTAGGPAPGAHVPAVVAGLAALTLALGAALVAGRAVRGARRRSRSRR